MHTLTYINISDKCVQYTVVLFGRMSHTHDPDVGCFTSHIPFDISLLPITT